LFQAAGHVGHHCDSGVTAVCRRRISVS
jgi:hypothetical protein